MKEKKGNIIQIVAGLVILIAGIVLCVNTYVVKGNKAYAVSLLTAIVGAVILISGLYSLFSKNEKKVVCRRPGGVLCVPCSSESQLEHIKPFFPCSYGVLQMHPQRH